MRAPVILIAVFLLHLGFIARCALVADPTYNKVIASGPNVDLLSNVKLLPNGTNSYSVYWYNYTTASILQGGPGYINTFFQMGRCSRFNIVPHPTKQNSAVIAGVIERQDIGTYSISWAVLDNGAVTYSSNLPGVPVVTEPGLAFVTKDLLVMTYDSTNQVKRRSSQATNQVLGTKGVLFLNTTSTLWGTSLLYTSGIAYQTGGGVSAINGTGNWLAVWDDQGSHTVYAQLGDGTTPLTAAPISTYDDTQLHSPVVAYPFVAYTGNSGNLYVVSVALGFDVAATYDMSTGSEPHLYSYKGKINVVVLSYVRASTEVCIRIQSVQYAFFSKPICWTESTSVTRPSSVVLPNGAIVVSYLTYTVDVVTVKTQLFNPQCGDGIISVNEECDGERNCYTNCTCKPLDQRLIGIAYGCPSGVLTSPGLQPIAEIITIPVVATPQQIIPPIDYQLPPDVVPLLDCYVSLNSTHVRGYFSYENLRLVTAQLPVSLSTPANAFSLQKNFGQPTTFTPGRSAYFPASVFAATWTKETITWYLTNYELDVDPTNTKYFCPQNVSVDIDVTVSKVPNATELAEIADQIADQLDVDPSRVSVTIGTAINGSTTITVTIIGGGSDAVTSALVAEKLVEVIKTAPSELEDKVKEVIPIEINQGGVRGKPDALTSQRGELSPTLTTPGQQLNSAMSLSCSLLPIGLLFVLLDI